MNEGAMIAATCSGTSWSAAGPWPVTRGGWRCGLAVLQHRGVFGWLHTWRALTPTPADPPGSPARARPRSSSYRCTSL